MNGMDETVSTYLSKSLYVRGLQCHKSLYLHKNNPELRDEISDELEALFESGHEVGKYAHQLFPGGFEIPYEGLSHEEKVKLTMAELKKGTGTIYEATFSHDGVFVRVDILHRGARVWELYEVKSSTEVKDVYLDDAAIQYYVLKGSGLNVSKVFLVHINNQYVRNGEIDPHKLFTMTDLTEIVLQKQESVPDNLAKMREMLLTGMPAIDIGEYCEKPYDCDFQGHCWQHIPDGSVFDLKGRGVNPYDLYRQGIIRIDQVDLDSLNSSQRIQAEGFLYKKEYLHRDEVEGFLATLWYPLYFLDFETFKTAIPMFIGTRPYMDIPFQYSLHSLAKEQSKLKHTEYIAYPHIDFREELLNKLLKEIPANACILAYNSAYEKRVLNYMAEQFPAYKDRIDDLNGRMKDLAVPFRNRNVYHPEMNGSYSLKAVLPVLVPDLSYEGLEISDGGMAMEAYFRLCELTDSAEIEKLRQALREYCTLDTLGMVKLLEKLKELCH